MKRLVLFVVGAVTVIGIGACSSAGYASVSFTSSDSIVAGCQKVGDLAVEKSNTGDATAKLADQARSKGANFVLRSSEDALTGTAYRCETPRVASR